MDSVGSLPTFKHAFQLGADEIKYKLEPNKQQDGYLGYIKVKGLVSGNYKVVPVQWQDDLTAKSMLEYMQNPRSIKVSVISSGNSKTIQIEKASEGGAAIGTPRMQDEEVHPLRLDYVFLKNAWDLAEAIEKEESRLELSRALVEQLIIEFTRDGYRPSHYIRELVPLVKVMNRDELGAVIKKLIDHNYFVQDSSWNGLARFFSIFQRVQCQQEINKAIAEQKTPLRLPAEQLFGLNADQLIGFGSALQHEISKRPITRVDASRLPALEALIEALALLESMGVKRVNKEAYFDPLYTVLYELSKSDNLNIAALASYGLQIMIRIGDDETAFHAALRCGFYFVKGLVSLGTAIVNRSFSPISGAVQDFQRAVEFQKGKEDWYTILTGLRCALLRGDRKSILAFFHLLDVAVIAGEVQIEKIVKSMPTHNAFFSLGLARLLDQILKEYSHDEEVCRKSVELLYEIGVCNLNNEHAENGLFTVGSFKHVSLGWVATKVSQVATKGRTVVGVNYGLQLEHEVYNLLLHCAADHPSDPIRALAEQSARRIHIGDVELANKTLTVPRSSSSRTSTFFDEVVNARAGWRIGFQRLYQELKNDPQLRELVYYTESEVYKNATPVPLSLNVEINKFLSVDNTDKSLLITGGAGSGKSIGVKGLAQRIWEKDRTYLPVVVSATTANSPDDIVDSALRKYQLEAWANDLRRGDEVKILWIIDGVDEAEGAQDRYLYDLNRLNEWGNSKVIFTCRSDRLKPQSYRNFAPGADLKNGFIHLAIQSFDPGRMRQMLEKLLPVIASPWSVDRFMGFIESRQEFKTLVSTPLYLMITAKTLPSIIEERARQGVSPNDPVTEKDLLDAYFCQSVIREEDRIRERAPHTQLQEREAYLKYAVAVAEVLTSYRKDHGTAWIPRSEAIRAHPELFSERNDEAMHLSRVSSLVIREGCYGFYHEIFRGYFAQLTFDQDMEEALIDKLNQWQGV